MLLSRWKIEKHCQIQFPPFFKNSLIVVLYVQEKEVEDSTAVNFKSWKHKLFRNNFEKIQHTFGQAQNICMKPAWFESRG